MSCAGGAGDPPHDRRPAAGADAGQGSLDQHRARFDEDALLRELVAGRLDAVLDVTNPELPPPGSPLYSLPNVLFTPHVAGSPGGELHRLADHALDEVERFTAGLPFAEPVRRDALGHSA